jgi:hypothetical protein
LSASEDAVNLTHLVNPVFTLNDPSYSLVNPFMTLIRWLLLSRIRLFSFS